MASAPSRDWAALPRDVLWEIFFRLPHADILCGAGLVCASWRRLADDEPMLRRRIDIASVSSNEESSSDGESPPDSGLLAMARAAVDRMLRSGYDWDDAPSLRSLHVTSFFRLPKESVDLVVPKLATLEQLVLSRGLTTFATLGAILEHCPRLQLLDAGGCYLGGWLSKRLLALLSERRTAEVLTLPRRLHPVEPKHMMMLAEDDY
ncbi:hypothetical protein ACP70R_014328 [Stipagrostis hirtigluma subsp. patula]